ncbi:MAG: transposase [Patescibacteria group bacterium]
MRRIQFENDGYYHIYNRGLNKAPLFFDENDYLRFLWGIYYFNDSNFVPEDFPYQKRYQGLALDKNFNRKELVNVVTWCLMPNHYHLVISQKNENGITKFMHRLGTGYTMYINRKYESSGHVFQGTFKAKLVENNEYLQHLTRYIHLNPINIHDPAWKERGVKNLEISKEFLLKYKWSSLRDYLNVENRFQLTSPSFKDFLFTDDPIEYSEFLWDWLKTGIPNNFSVLSKA